MRSLGQRLKLNEPAYTKYRAAASFSGLWLKVFTFEVRITASNNFFHRCPASLAVIKGRAYHTRINVLISAKDTMIKTIALQS